LVLDEIARPGGTMSTIRLDGLSLEEAEEAIARVWRVLEAGGIPSPTATVKFVSRDRANLDLVFRNTRHAEVVSDDLERRFPAILVSER
jgi:hypothetical protein